MVTLNGERIVLRPYRAEDAQAIWDGTNNPTMRRLTGTHATFTLEQIQAYITRTQTADDRAAFIIALPETLAPVGEVILLDLDEANRSAGLRIALFHDEHLGKGYGTEAMRLAVAYGFTDLALHRIELQVFDFNPRAIHVYEKVGFQREGILRDALFYEGMFHDTLVMGILEDEWREKARNSSKFKGESSKENLPNE